MSSLSTCSGRRRKKKKRSLRCKENTGPAIQLFPVWNEASRTSWQEFHSHFHPPHAGLWRELSSHSLTFMDSDGCRMLNSSSGAPWHHPQLQVEPAMPFVPPTFEFPTSAATGRGQRWQFGQNATKKIQTKGKGLTANSLSGSFSPFLTGLEWVNCCTSLAL